MSLNAPECSYGYPMSQLEREMDAETLARFQAWIYSQTMAICDGRRYNRDTGEYDPTGHAHGLVAYQWDVECFLGGGEVVD
jgi:hypothetical protein